MSAHDDIYARIEPDPIVYDMHHMVPESWWRRVNGGAAYPVDRWPLLRLAPSTHRRLHVALDAIVAAGSPAQVQDPERFGKVWPYAARAYQEAVLAGLVPSPTLLPERITR